MEECFFLAQQKKIDPQKNPFQFRLLFNGVLDEKINKNLVLIAAEKDTSIVVSHEDIKKNLEGRIDFFVQQLGSIESLEKEMGMSIQEIKSRYHEEIREELFIGGFQQKLFGSMGISRSEVFSFYENFKDSLPKTPSKSSFSLIQKKVELSASSKENLLKRINSLRDSLILGFLDFEEEAIRISQDPSVAVNKGKMITSRGDLVPEYERVAYFLKVDEISSPILTEYGYHLIKLLNRVGEKITSQHILFLTEPKEEDFRFVEKNLTNLLIESKNDPGLFDSLAVVEKGLSGGFSGVYENVDISSFPLSFVSSFKEGEDYSFSNVFFDDVFCYLFYKYNYIEEEKSSLDNSWKEIELLALEFKRKQRFDLWVKEQKKKTYVKINSIY